MESGDGGNTNRAGNEMWSVPLVHYEGREKTLQELRQQAKKQG